MTDEDELSDQEHRTLFLSFYQILVLVDPTQKEREETEKRSFHFAYFSTGLLLHAHEEKKWSKKAADQKDRKRETEKRKEGEQVFFLLFFVFATSIDLNARSQCADTDCEGVSEGVS